MKHPRRGGNIATTRKHFTQSDCFAALYENHPKKSMPISPSIS
jgi:hypothetical protein